MAQAAKTLLELMAKHGPATCHHTSPNPALVAYAARLLEVGYSPSEVQQLLSKVVKWYAKLDNPEIVRQIERLIREVMTEAASRTVESRTTEHVTTSRGAAAPGSPASSLGSVHP
ncbi:hypothetical protein [Methanopyrus sp.]